MTMTSEKFDWSPRRLDTLRQLIAEKVPFTAIAARLGTSKGSVAGKAQRMGLTECKAETLDGGKSRRGKHIRGRDPRPGSRRFLAANPKPHLIRGPADFLFAARPKQAETTADVQPRKVPAAPSVRVDSEARVSDSGLAHPAGRNVPFAELNDRGCKFPVTPHHVAIEAHRFCNARRPVGCPYCDEHRHRAWTERTLAAEAA